MKHRLFTISDFCISTKHIPKVIADRILEFHLRPLQSVQDNCIDDLDVFVSLNSCWRPYSWEISHGRNGESQHTFGQRLNGVILEEKGACDITCSDFANKKDALLEALINDTNYIRFAVYNGFIHADYKDTNDGKRILFDVVDNKWKFKKFID